MKLSNFTIQSLKIDMKVVHLKIVILTVKPNKNGKTYGILPLWEQIINSRSIHMELECNYRLY